ETAASPLDFETTSAPFATYTLGCGLFKRSLFDKIGLLDKSLLYSEDVDWYLRAIEARVPMVILKEVTQLYRRNDKNMTVPKKIEDISRSYLKVLRKSLGRRRTQQAGREPTVPDLSEFIETKNEIGK